MKGDAGVAKKLTKRAKKNLKADEILSQRSAIPAVPMRKRAGDKTTSGVLPLKRQRTNWVPQKELARLKKVADGQHGNFIEAKDAHYDVWDMPAKKDLDHQTDFLPDEQPTKAPRSMKQKPISLTASGKQVAAVQKPKAGFSYNPLFTDYEARLTEESAKAVETERKRLDAEETDKQRQEAAARSAAEAEAAEEKANMSEWEEDSEWEGVQSEAEDGRPSAKQPKRKTPTQRNRIKRRKEEEKLAKHKAALKARRVQEHRISDIAQEVEDYERHKAITPVEMSDSDSEIDDTKLRRKQLGKYKLPEKDLELVLPDELEESLRRLRPEGNLLRDRYRSMLVRGKIESRRHLPFRKQAKRKLTEKWTYKDFTL